MPRATKPVVLITGVSSGIGLAAAKLFVKRGWIVVGTVRTRARGSEAGSLKIDLQMADMFIPRDLERVVQTAWRTYGRLDALVCNAGYGLVGPIDTLDYARMQEQLAVNTLAPAELIRQTVPLMRRQGSGVIVGVSSLVGRNGFPGYSLYAASKFGLEGLLESLAMELAASHIRVKLVEPSGVNTPFWANIERGQARSAEPTKSYRGLSAETIASAIYKASTDRNSRLRYPVGLTIWLALVRRALPERLALRLLRRALTGS